MNLAKRMLLAIVGLFIVTICMSRTQADTIALVDTGYQPGLISSLSADTADRTVGWEFIPTCDVWITQLGYFDSGQDGLNIHHEIGIWDASQQLVVSATVPSGLTDSLAGEYRYVSVSSTLLPADQYFIIGATVPSPIVWPSGFETDEYPAKTPFIDPNAILFDSCISLVAANRYAQDNTVDMFELDFPDSYMPTKNFTDPLGGQEITIEYYFFAPNFGFVLELEPSPEPTTLMLLMLGATAVLGCPGKWRSTSQLSCSCPKAITFLFRKEDT